MEFTPVVNTPLPDDAPEWAKTLNDNMGNLASGINQIGVAVFGAADAIDNIKNEVGPIVDRVSSHPMLRMLVGG